MNVRRTAVGFRQRMISRTMGGLLAVLVVARAAGQVPGPSTPKIPNTPCVRLVNSPAVTVNQATGEGTADFDLRNQTDKEVNVALVATVSSPANSSIYATFVSATQTQPKRIYETVLPAKTTASLKLIVQEDWDDAEFDIEIANHYGTEKIGKVHVRRFPVGVKVDGTDRLKLALVDGITTRVALRNDDPLSYPVSFVLVNGEKVCEGDGELRPKALGVLECTPHLDPSFSRVVDLIKSGVSHDGYRLLLTPRVAPALHSSDKILQPIKAFPVEASIDYFSPLLRGVANYLVVFVVLIIGGVSSLLLSYTLPNKLQRLDLRDKLRELAAGTADLSTRIESRLAVLVRLERSRLSDLLRSRSTVSPDFSSVALQCTNGITRLTAKVGVLEQMDVVLGRLIKKLAQGVPPTQIDEINASLQDASVLLGKGEVSDADVQAANAAVCAASASVDKLNDLNDEFGKDLATEIHQVVTDIDGSIATSPTYLQLTARIPGPNLALRAVEPTDQIITADRYVELDMALQKIRIIRDYVALRDGTSDPSMIARLNARVDQLAGQLQLGSWEALRSARLLLREMQDDIFPERLVEALRHSDAFIEMDPSIAYEQAPLEFCASFRKAALNTAAAREEIDVVWDFGDGLKGKGWTVSHYFQIRRRQNTYQVQARFYGPNGEILSSEAGDPIVISSTVEVNPSETGRGVGERTRTEVLKLAAALLIAVFGLVSGAQEQIAKLDLLPGLVAVFLVGFSADSIKRLLTTTKA
jgi:hypothetical protein